MIYITGDLHADHGISKLDNKNFKKGLSLTKDDYLIITGDFGLVWDKSKRQEYWRKWLNNKPYTTLFVDGNHECFDQLDAMPLVEWNGGKVHFVEDSIIHLTRGQIFNLQGKRFFTFGGADSIDKHSRLEGISW